MAVNILKQTEVGPLPNDWQVVALETLLQQPPKYGINAAATPYDLNLLTYLRITDITADGRFQHDSRASVSHPDASDYLMAEGDLVLARTGASVGKSYLYNVSDGALVFAGFLIQVRPDKRWLLPEYLKFQLQSESYWRWVTVNSMRSGQPGINGKEYASLPLALPPTLTEQKAIATALSDMDALIEAVEQLISKKRLIKQGAMQELLTGRRRLPGFEGEWGTTTYEQAFDFLSTATNSRSDLSSNGDVYYVHYGDIHTKFHSHINFSKIQLSRIDRKLCGNATSIQDGDWILADASEDLDGVGKAVEVCGLDETTTAIAGLHTFLLREREDTFELGFKGHLGGLAGLHEELIRICTGMKVYGVSKKALRTLSLPVPPKAEQKAIATTLSAMDDELEALEIKLNKLRHIKRAMMHNLLTGAIRLV